MIAAAQLTTANIVSADIRWADIEALTASIAQISKACLLYTSRCV